MVDQAEEAAEQEAAAAKEAAASFLRPPTAVLGFAPPSQNTPPPSSSGKHSWPAHFFNKPRHKQLQTGDVSGDHSIEQAGSGPESWQLPNGVHHAADDGDVNGAGIDYGAAWRDAAEAALPSLDDTADAGEQLSTCVSAYMLFQTLCICPLAILPD